MNEIRKSSVFREKRIQTTMDQAGYPTSAALEGAVVRGQTGWRPESSLGGHVA